MDTPEEVFESFGIELKHYGIPGMRWGVRRDVGRNGRVVKRGSAGGAPKASRSESSDYKSTKKLRAKDLRQMSNAEIQELNRRLQLEKSYNELMKQKSTINKGQKAVKDTLAVVGTVNEGVKAWNSPAGKYVRQETKKVVRSVRS